MSQPDKPVYAATCNPSRRAKRPRASTSEPDTSPSQQPTVPSVGTTQPRPILPKRSPIVKPTAHTTSTIPSVPLITSEPSNGSLPASTNPPNKRGRKPGPLSRSAREAQRRLNHSIIEKARRTKINNALATLRELVPVDYGRKPKSQESNNSDDDEDCDEDDEDGEYAGGEKKKPKSKSTGKKEEKEREYKLEILVRTVAYMQDLLYRVSALEQANSLCSKCGDNINVARTHTTTTTTTARTPMSLDSLTSSTTSPEVSDPEPSYIHRSKRSRTEEYNPKPAEAPQVISSIHSPSFPQNSLPQENLLLTRHRLPSISSWLPQTLLDPSIFNATSPTRIDFVRSTNVNNNNKESIPLLQLPTPPSSTQFQATASIAPAPNMNAGTVYLPSSLSGNPHQKITSSPMLTRTPEDEHAATMLLQISSSLTGSGSCGGGGGGGGGASVSSASPIFRPLPPAIVTSSSSQASPTRTTQCVAFSSLPSSSTTVRNSRSRHSTSSTATVAVGAAILGNGRRGVDVDGISVQTPASLLGLIGPTTS